MDDYPISMVELEKRFATQEACLNYLAGLRWPSGYVCLRCAASKGWEMTNGLILCASCRRQQSVIAGTVFQDSHMPLPTWFRAMWHVCANKNGMSAQNLQRLLGLRSYNTAWLCLHKLRRAMVRPGRECLSGVVEADETYVGGPREGKSGRGAFGKQIVFIAAEVRGRKIGRIRLSHIPGVSGATLVPAVSGAVTAGATVRTDGWKGYNGVAAAGYKHEVTVENADELADIVLPKCHLVISLLKRWILGTLQGNVGKDHLQDYLNEFAFRFNRRDSKSRGLLFYRLAQMAVVTAPNPRSTIVPPQDVVAG
jgi:transposase-like protein